MTTVKIRKALKPRCLCRSARAARRTGGSLNRSHTTKSQPPGAQRQLTRRQAPDESQRYYEANDGDHRGQTERATPTREPAPRRERETKGNTRNPGAAAKGRAGQRAHEGTTARTARIGEKRAGPGAGHERKALGANQTTHRNARRRGNAKRGRAKATDESGHRPPRPTTHPSHPFQRSQGRREAAGGSQA